MKPTLLDLFCGAGGASMGYHRAGFDVTGVDIHPQPHYPFRFVQTDAMTAKFLGSYDVIHASPPCQNYCWSTAGPRARGKKYVDLVSATRRILTDSNKYYVIENVPTAPLVCPTILNGDMFGLGVLRRRGFETNWWLPRPATRPMKKTIMQQSKKDPRVFIKKSAYCTVAGSGADGWSCCVADWRVAMGIDWMNRKEITQAIPPKYTEYIGKYLITLV